MSRGSRMSEHPRVLVEAARLQAMAVEERRAVRRRGFGTGCGLSSGEIDRVAGELVEDQEQIAEMEALSR